MDDSRGISFAELNTSFVHKCMGAVRQGWGSPEDGRCQYERNKNVSSRFEHETSAFRINDTSTVGRAAISLGYSPTYGSNAMKRARLIAAVTAC
jgi:hypothetical protein